MKSLHLLALLMLTSLVVFPLGGCGGEDNGAGGDAAGGPAYGDVKVVKKARRIIETGGYLPGPVPAIRHMVNGGLFAIGDIDTDGYTDLVVASGKYPGSFAALSGRDGAEIWRVNALTGKAAEAAGENGYSITWVFVTGDVNGDGVNDVFFQDAWGDKVIFLVSGKDGSRIARGDAGQIAPSARSEDMNSDGVPDVVCVYYNITSPKTAERSYDLNLGARVFSGVDLSEAGLYEKVVDAGEWQSRADWILGRFDDMNGDGIDECVVSYETGDSQEVFFLSGKDFAELSRISIAWDKVRGRRRYACGGDLNGDGVADLVKASQAGRGENGDTSYLAAYSGADGATLWEVAGTSLPAGLETFRLNVKTGETMALAADVEFGDTAVVLPDLDGDGRSEIAAVLPTPVKDKREMGVLIFSGATGKHLAVLRHDGKDFRPTTGAQMAVMEDADGRGAPGLAVSGKVSDKKYGVAIFELDDLR